MEKEERSLGIVEYFFTKKRFEAKISIAADKVMDEFKRWGFVDNIQNNITQEISSQIRNDFQIKIQEEVKQKLITEIINQIDSKEMLEAAVKEKFKYLLNQSMSDTTIIHQPPPPMRIY